jgi:hypothetical protein
MIPLNRRQRLKKYASDHWIGITVAATATAIAVVMVKSGVFTITEEDRHFQAALQKFLDEYTYTPLEA